MLHSASPGLNVYQFVTHAPRLHALRFACVSHWVNAVTQFLCAFKDGSDARQYMLSHSGFRTCFTSMYTTLQSHCSLAGMCDTAAVLLRKLTVSDKQNWQGHKVEQLWLRIHIPRRCSALAICHCSRKLLTCGANSYDFDSLDLEAPDIDNDLESYQVGVQAALLNHRHDSYFMFTCMTICRHSWEPNLM